MMKLKDFYWINPQSKKKLAGMAFPNSSSIVGLQELGVGLVVNLTEQVVPEYLSALQSLGVEYLSLPVVDQRAPSNKQMQDFFTALSSIHDSGKHVAIHCQAGKGRTGTMVACWLVAFCKLSSEEAIKLVRDASPDSIESKEQELFIQNFSLIP